MAEGWLNIELTRLKLLAALGALTDLAMVAAALTPGLAASVRKPCASMAAEAKS